MVRVGAVFRPFVAIFCLASFISPVSFGAIQCTWPDFIWESPTEWTYLPRGRTRLTHMGEVYASAPRLVYWKPVPGTIPGEGDQCDEIFVREGTVALTYSLGSANDWRGKLPVAALAPFTCPKIEDLAIYQTYIAISISDGRDVPTASKLNTQLLVFELQPHGIGYSTPMIAASLGATQTMIPHFRDLKFDHEPDPFQMDNPFLSWIQTYEFFTSTYQQPDTVYYCRTQQCGSPPTDAGVWNLFFRRITRQWVSEQSKTALAPPAVTFPQVQAGVSYKKSFQSPTGQTTFTFDEGIFEVGSSFSAIGAGGTAEWLDLSGSYAQGALSIDETPMGHFEDYVFYRSSDFQRRSRMRIANIHQPPTPPQVPIWVHNPGNYDGYDENLIVGDKSGLSRLGFTGRLFAFESNDNQTFDYYDSDTDRWTWEYNASDIVVGSTTDISNPMSYKQLVGIPDEHFAFLHGVSGNLLVVSGLPNSSAFERDYIDLFVDNEGSSLAFVVHCMDL